MPVFATILLLFLTALSTPSVAQDATVRVRLLERKAPTTVAVSAEHGPVQLRVGPALLGTLAAGETATVETSGGGVTVRFRAVIETVEQVTFVPRDGADFRLRTGSIDRHYHGALTVSLDDRPGRLRLINTVGLEDYVASVVASEYPFREIEGIKAQAVLARTYALKARGKYGDYDLVDHVGSQVYRGIGSETPHARRAAEATHGEILTYRGAPIEAVYSSSSGGHTADNDAVWSGRPLPYLRGRHDPFDHIAPDHEWVTTVGRAELLRALSRRYGTDVTGLTIAETSREGRVRSLRLLGPRPRTFPANDVRLALNDAFGPRLLRSTYFQLHLRGDRYEFHGRGFGHGVGMSQHGAREQARQGYSYRDILAFYFDGTRLAQHDTAGPELPAYAERRRSTPVEPIPVRPVSTERTYPERPLRVGW
jgi:stage II sporulation protein D